MKSKLVTPHAAVLIWNYNDRVDSQGGGADVHSVEQVVIGTSSVISISTMKKKSIAAGSFEIRLSPRFNWVTRITPGSWCAILMSQEQIPTMKSGNVGVAQEKSFRMLGRIDSVRGVVEADQQTGAKKTMFIITGQDWGSVFDSNLYIDPIAANDITKGDSIVQAYTVLGINMYNSQSDSKTMPSSAELVDTIISLWGAGATGSAITADEAKLGPSPSLTPLLISSHTQFRLPKEVATFMKQGKTVAGKVIPGTLSVNFKDVIYSKHGKLSDYDTYTTIKESFGIPQPSTFFGKHTFWQLLNDLSNSVLNELINDIRWDNDGNPKFTLYHRIKPFVNDSNFMEKLATLNPLETASISAAKSTVNDNVSLFSNVRQIKIDLDDVLNINFGTNWRDKINFIEITPTSQLLGDSQAFDAKLSGQTIDRAGYERDGFKPMFIYSPFMPYAQGSTPMVKEMTHWKYLLRDWYFNTHLMLNGAVTVIGQDKYIQVGDNIMIPSQVLGGGYMNVGQRIPQDTYLLAHVEAVMHNFTVNQDTGARTYNTNIQFVRGVITDSNGTSINLIDGNAIDGAAKSLTGPEERNHTVFGTSTSTDPDEDKIKGT